MWIARTVADMRQRRAELRGSVALVPTMGALHDGHLALMHRAGELADQFLVSIFVNPTQFGAGEDFGRYPRPLEQDLQHCAAAGADGVFVPAVEDMYPPGQIACEVQVPALAGLLECAARPGHFAGVCRVVAKLLNIIGPDFACFGRKDYQQLRIIEAMVRDLAIDCRIEAIDTVREADGLALSSRNVYLGPGERARAVALYQALTRAKQLVEEHGERDAAVVERAMLQVMQAQQMEVDYAVLRHPATLQPIPQVDPQGTGGVVALIAARVGKVRLIDNLLLGR